MEWERKSVRVKQSDLNIVKEREGKRMYSSSRNAGKREKKDKDKKRQKIMVAGTNVTKPVLNRFTNPG